MTFHEITLQTHEIGDVYKDQKAFQITKRYAIHRTLLINQDHSKTWLSFYYTVTHIKTGNSIHWRIPNMLAAARIARDMEKLPDPSKYASVLPDGHIKPKYGYKSFRKKVVTILQKHGVQVS